MALDIINPRATVTIGFEGLAVLCFNKSYNRDQGRWEVAIPRFDDHNLTIQFGDSSPVVIDRTVKLIEIKDRVGVRPEKPTHEVGRTFDRMDREKNDKNDYRWVRDFTNSKELPHRNVRPITNDPNRVKVTMMYVYDAVFYTKRLDSPAVTLVRAAQTATAPVKGGSPARFAPRAASVLNRAKDAGTETKVLGMDIESPVGGTVDIFFDKALRPDVPSIPKGDSPQEIFIRNLETPSVFTDDRLLITRQSEFGLGDFFRYYQLFQVDGTKSHFWGRVDPGNGHTLDCCCNKIRVGLANLDAFLESDAPA